MEAHEVTREFFKSIRRVDRSVYVEEEVPTETEEEKLNRYVSKVTTKIVSSGPRHILRRPA